MMERKSEKKLRLWIVSLEWEKIKIKKKFFRKLNKPKYEEKHREYIHKKDPIQKRKKEGETQKHKDITAERKRKGDMKKKKKKNPNKAKPPFEENAKSEREKAQPIKRKENDGMRN